jgi:hypothetical protein
MLKEDVMTKIIDMESPEFELVILRAMVRSLISMHQENLLGHLPYPQIKDLMDFRISVKEQFDQVNVLLSHLETNMTAIENNMITVKGNILTKTDMHDVFAEMLPKIVAAVKQS